MKTTLKWDADYCNEVVKVFFKDFEQVNSSISTHKRSSIFKSQQKDFFTWMIYKKCDDLVKDKLGEGYCVNNWVFGLRYDVGDYMIEHVDGEAAGDRVLSGGIELSDPSDYDGGIYHLHGKPARATRGEIFIHTLKDKHHVSEVTRGTRYSIHFTIGKVKYNL